MTRRKGPARPKSRYLLGRLTKLAGDIAMANSAGQDCAAELAEIAEVRTILERRLEFGRVRRSRAKVDIGQ